MRLRPARKDPSRRRAAGILARAAALATCVALPPLALAGSGSLQQDVRFSEYSELATSTRIVQRLLSPLSAAQIGRSLQSTHQRLAEQPIDLAAETFTVYVPAVKPPGGYGLLVFIAPWPQAHLPRGWDVVLDRYGVIFVTAARSGNEASVLERRAPLALLAAGNVMRRYAVDPERVFAGGFSGGSRVAERLALGYPDLFRGALLNSGSDPIEGNPVAAPARELLQRFQESSRLVYVTGEHDPANLTLDASSIQSMHHWCVYDTEARVIPGAAHEVAPAASLDSALRALLQHSAANAGKTAACRAELQQQVAQELARVARLIAGGKGGEARKQLAQIDRRFGGAAAPRSVELQSEIEGLPAG